MMYTPHILQKKVTSTVIRDEYGRIVNEPSEEWVDVCRCRCDDNSTKEFRTENGEVYRPNYHVVCERNGVAAGDVVRCLDKDAVRGQGKAFMVKTTNFYDYTEIWM